MIRETRDEGMPVVQVEMHVLADRADRRMTSSTSCAALPTASWTSAARSGNRPSCGLRPPRLRPGWLRPNLADACLMPTWPTSMQQLTRSASRSRSATSTNHPGSRPAAYSRKTKGAARPLAQTRIELPHHAEQAVGLCLHLPLVVDNEAGDTARETVGEFPDDGAATLVQHIDAAVEVDHRQVRVRGHEPQNMLKLVWRVGIQLGGQAHLGEAEPSKLKQRVVPCDAPLEQAMNRPEHPTAHTGFRDAQFTKDSHHLSGHHP